MIKIKHTETIDGKLVCKAKLVLIIPNRDVNDETTASCFNSKTRNWYTPIFISEIEEIISGIDYIYYPAIKKYALSPKDCISTNIINSKVIALPEHFPPQLLQDIVDGRLKNGDEVYLKCDYVDRVKVALLGEHEAEYKILLNQQNHVSMVNVKKEESWDDIILKYNEYSKGNPKSFYKWVKDKYHPPIKKN